MSCNEVWKEWNETRLRIAYTIGNDRLQESEKEKDLGVIINNRLSPEEHIQEKVKKICITY